MPLHDGPMHPAVACYVFDPSFTKLLFIRHRKVPLAGRWLPPGGHVDGEESPDQAAVREVLEETGQHVLLLDLSPPGCGGESPRVRRLPGPLVVQIEDLGDHRHLDFVFVSVAPQPQPLVLEAEDQPVAWFDAEAVAREPLLPDCVAHATHLLAEAPRYRALWRAQTGAM